MPDYDELMAALDELRRRAAPLIEAGIPEGDAYEQVAAGDKPIIEGESAAQTALRFGIIPRRPLLTPETARELLRECVTVVKPGEVLVMSMPDWMTPMQVREVYDVVRYWRDEQAPDLKVMVVPHCDFAVAPEHPEEAA